MPGDLEPPTEPGYVVEAIREGGEGMVWGRQDEAAAWVGEGWMGCQQGRVDWVQEDELGGRGSHMVLILFQKQFAMQLKKKQVSLLQC